MLHQYSFALFAIISIVLGENPHVTIPQGTLKGHTMKSAKGREFHAYQSIPYAQPPIEKLRFKPTQPAEPWNGILDATKECSVCPQIDLLATQKFTGKEDCLVLNVYIPQILTGNGISKLPVMVFIHGGGGYMVGSSRTDFCSPVMFMDRDVVLVTINYRLGALGYLSTGDEVSPGNYGLYDQVEALKWVKKNIAYFGGDPQKVTIFGESAGAISVSHLVVSPKAKDLFGAAIMQSGSSLSNFSLIANPNKWAKVFAIQLGCPAHTSKRIIDCLKTKSAEEIVAAQKDVNIMPFSMVFAPVVENTPEGFLPEHPLKLLTKNKNKIPTISGVNKDEGAYNVAHSEAIFDLYSPEFLETDFLEIAPTSLVLENRIQATRKVVRHYFQNVDRSNKVEVRKALTKIFSDGYFNAGAEKLAEALSENGWPTYTYMFTHRGKSSFIDLYGIKEDYGVGHADELQYMFNSSFFKRKLEGDDEEVSELILHLWTHFARTHDPTPGNDLPFKWLQTDSCSPKYLDINVHPKMVNKKLTENVELWDEIFGKTTSDTSMKYEL